MAREGIVAFAPIIDAMRAKDPALWSRVAILPPDMAWREWKSAYPEDFPLGGLTAMNDLSAIKPKATTPQFPDRAGDPGNLNPAGKGVKMADVAEMEASYQGSETARREELAKKQNRVTRARTLAQKLASALALRRAVQQPFVIDADVDVMELHYRRAVVELDAAITDLDEGDE